MIVVARLKIFFSCNKKRDERREMDTRLLFYRFANEMTLRLGGIQKKLIERWVDMDDIYQLLACNAEIHE